MNGYDLTRNWFDWCFENPEKINPSHTAIFCFAIEHCNRLGWKEKFGFPTQMVMDAIGIKKHQTYIVYFNDLCDWGFFKLIQKSANQYSANIISLSSAKTKNGKALDKAFIKHAAKQTQPIGQSTGQSIGSIDKPTNQETINQETINNTNHIFINEEKVYDLKTWVDENFGLQKPNWERLFPLANLNEALDEFLLKHAFKKFNDANHFRNSFGYTLRDHQEHNEKVKKLPVQKHDSDLSPEELKLKYAVSK